MNKLLNIKTKGYLRNNTSSRSSIPYREANQIGIIFTIDDREKHEMVKEFIKKLELDDKRVSVLCYLPANKQNYEFKFDFFNDKDVSFWGHISAPSVNRFVETPFDFIFYLDTEPNPLLLNLLARCRGKCRLGKFWEGSRPFLELMIETNEGLHGLIDEMYKYASLLG